MKYTNSFEEIKRIEEKGMTPLIERGIAKLEHNSEGSVNPDFGAGIENAFFIKKYVLMLRTNYHFLFVHAKIDFLYDKRKGTGRINISSQSRSYLADAFENAPNGDKHNPLAELVRYRTWPKETKHPEVIKIRWGG